MIRADNILLFQKLDWKVDWFGMTVIQSPEQ